MVKRPEKFAIDVSIPAANDTGAEDQEPMKQNFVSINGFVSVDHVAPGTTNPANTAGKHKQITFDDYHPPGKLLDPVSVAYTNVGRADSSHPQHYWRNSQAILPLSSIRAFGLIKITSTGSGTTFKPAASLESKYNLESVKYIDVVTKTVQKQLSYHQFDIVLTGNAVFETNPAIFVNIDKPFNNTYFYLYEYDDNILSVFMRQSSFISPTKFSVLFMQI